MSSSKASQCKPAWLSSTNASCAGVVQAVSETMRTALEMTKMSYL
jgi:hypothetical protein